MIFELPHGEKIEIKTLVLDLNGTLTVRGEVPYGVPQKMKKLQNLGMKIVFLSGDSRGTARKISKKFSIELIIAKNASEKEKAILKLNSSTCAAIGNSRIDIGMFRRARISIVTLQAEGIHAKVLKYADIIALSINDALDLFIDKKSFVATMRK